MDFDVENTPVGTPRAEDKNEDDYDGEDKEEEEDGEDAGSDDGGEQDEGAEDGEEDEDASKSTSDVSKEDIQKKIERLSKVTVMYW